MPPSPRRRKLRMLRDGEPPDDMTLLIRATPSSVDEAVLDISEDALDSADIYEVERPGGRVALYGVSVFARPPGAGAGDLLRRFASSPFYLEATVSQLRTAGFEVLPTGTNPDHFDVLLVDGRSPTAPLIARVEVELAARRLVEACGEMHPNPSYARSVDD